jgi:lipoprotein-releasing system permease protein
MPYEFFIAWKYLTRRKKSGFISMITVISILGVGVGVMALIVVLAVMSGFDRELKTKIVGMNPHIYVEALGGIAEPDDTVLAIRQLGLPEILTVAKTVQGQAIIRSSQNAIGVVVKGVDMESRELAGLEKYLKSGSFDFSELVLPKMDPLPGCVIGNELAMILRAGVGDTVYLISPFLEKADSAGSKALARKAESMPFVVRGIFSMGMNDFDTQLALISLRDAQKLYPRAPRVSGLSVRLKDVDAADRIKFAIQDRLGLSFFARSWMDMNFNFFSALKIEKAVMAILLFLIILVAAFNIVSTLIMVAMEKTRDIGILRALGATSWGIRRIFFLQGLTVGVLGVTVGGVSGLWVASRINEIADYLEKTTGLAVFPSDVYYFSKIPTEINLPDVALIMIFALAASVLAGLYPAHKASRLKPVEALRYE